MTFPMHDPWSLLICCIVSLGTIHSTMRQDEDCRGLCKTTPRIAGYELREFKSFGRSTDREQSSDVLLILSSTKWFSSPPPLEHHFLAIPSGILTANTTFWSNILPPSCGTNDVSPGMLSDIWLSRSSDGVDIVLGTQYPESRHKSCGGVWWFLERFVVVFACVEIGNAVKR